MSVKRNINNPGRIHTMVSDPEYGRHAQQPKLPLCVHCKENIAVTITGEPIICPFCGQPICEICYADVTRTTRGEYGSREVDGCWLVK